MNVWKSILLSGVDYAKREFRWSNSLWGFTVTMFWAGYRAGSSLIAYWFFPVSKEQYEARKRKCLVCPIFYEPHVSCGYSGQPRTLSGCGCSLEAKWWDPRAECFMFLFLKDAQWRWPVIDEAVKRAVEKESEEET